MNMRKKNDQWSFLKKNWLNFLSSFSSFCLPFSMKSKPTSVVVSYLVFIKQHSSSSQEYSDTAVPVLTSRGLLCPSNERVHFSEEYGNVNLPSKLPGKENPAAFIKRKYNSLCCVRRTASHFATQLHIKSSFSWRVPHNQLTLIKSAVNNTCSLLCSGLAAAPLACVKGTATASPPNLNISVPVTILIIF